MMPAPEELLPPMNALSYRVILEPDEDDGGFNVVIPSFPTANTQGDDVDEALRNAREVIELELSYLAEKGLSIPPSDAENVRIERVTVAPPAA
jgi:predicted RNase H-like HicB family nuclease